MSRGQIRPTAAAEAQRRALTSICMVPTPPDGSPPDAGHRPIAYRLEELNGGKDPYAPHCADWSYGNRTPTADCIGFVLWCSGIDRLQPSYHGTLGEWLNCRSLIDDADGRQVFCTARGHLDAQPGDWLMTPDHIGIIVRPRLILPDGTEVSDHLVVDCSPRHSRSTAINTGLPWSERCRVIRYNRYTG